MIPLGAIAIQPTRTRASKGNPSGPTTTPRLSEPAPDGDTAAVSTSSRSVGASQAAPKRGNGLFKVVRSTFSSSTPSSSSKRFRRVFSSLRGRPSADETPPIESLDHPIFAPPPPQDADAPSEVVGSAAATADIELQDLPWRTVEPADEPDVTSDVPARPSASRASVDTRSNERAKARRFFLRQRANGQSRSLPGSLTNLAFHPRRSEGDSEVPAVPCLRETRRAYALFRRRNRAGTEDEVAGDEDEAGWGAGGEEGKGKGGVDNPAEWRTKRLPPKQDVEGFDFGARLRTRRGASRMLLDKDSTRSASVAEPTRATESDHQSLEADMSPGFFEASMSAAMDADEESSGAERLSNVRAASFSSVGSSLALKDAEGGVGSDDANSKPASSPSAPAEPDEEAEETRPRQDSPAASSKGVHSSATPNSDDPFDLDRTPEEWAAHERERSRLGQLARPRSWPS